MVLREADKIFFRTAAHPVYEFLCGLGKHLHSFDVLYTMPWSQSGDVYEFMVSALFKEAERHRRALYAVPGSANILEETTNLIRRRALAEGLQVRIIPGVSFLDIALGAIDFDFGQGLQVMLPLTHLESGRFTNRLGMLVCQIQAVSSRREGHRIDLTMKYLRAAYSYDHPVTLIWTDGLPDYETQTRTFPLGDLVSEYGKGKFFASLYVPPVQG
jgi:tetrapyrrole methylase family protein / MazG family protein